MKRRQLTSQRLRSLFKSNFDLAAYAISMARHNIRAGKEMTIDELLDDVQRNPYLESFEEEEEEEEEEKL